LDLLPDLLIDKIENSSSHVPYHRHQIALFAAEIGGEELRDEIAIPNAGE
jgi:hypothetical protein